MVSLYENATHLVVTGEKEELKTLSDNFRYQPPGYFHSDKYQRYRITRGKEGWDGYIYPFKVVGTAAKCLRGRRDEILALCKIYGFKVNTSKLLPRPFATLRLEDVRADLVQAEFELDEKQRRAVHQWLVHGIGIADLPVGSGKSATFAAAAAMIKERYPTQRVLYVTQSERLVRQAMKDLTGFLPHLHITQYGGGKNDDSGKDIVVCTFAMLNKNLNKLIANKFIKSFIAVLVDECHHVTSPSAERVLLEIPAFFRLGATGSPQDQKEDKQAKMIGLLGQIRTKAQSYEYIETGRQAKPHIYLVDIPTWHNKFANVPHTPPIDSAAFVLKDGVWTKGVYKGPVYEVDDTGNPVIKKKKILDENKEWISVDAYITVPGLHRIALNGEELEIESRWCLLHRTYDKSITRFNERNKLIVEWASHFHSRNLQTLVVCTRTLHIYVLEAMIQQVVDPEKVRILFSADSSGERDAAFEWFKATPGAILITPLVKEGVSINEINAGIVADYVSDFDVATQILGRFVRKKKTGENRAEIVWFVENQTPTYRRGCNTLFRHLEQVRGFTFYWPCSDPESIKEDLSYEGREIPELGSA